MDAVRPMAVAVLAQATAAVPAAAAGMVVPALAGVVVAAVAWVASAAGVVVVVVVAHHRVAAEGTGVPAAAGAAMAAGPVLLPYPEVLQGLEATVAAAPRAVALLVCPVQAPASRCHAQQGPQCWWLVWVQTSPCQTRLSCPHILRQHMRWQHLPWRPGRQQQQAGQQVLRQ